LTNQSVFLKAGSVKETPSIVEIFETIDGIEVEDFGPRKGKPAKRSPIAKKKKRQPQQYYP